MMISRRHTVYPPVTPVRYRRTTPAWQRFLLGLLAGLGIIAALVLGTAAAINQLEAWRAAPELAYLQGMAAGAQTCGSRP